MSSYDSTGEMNYNINEMKNYNKNENEGPSVEIGLENECNVSTSTPNRPTESINDNLIIGANINAVHGISDEGFNLIIDNDGDKMHISEETEGLKKQAEDNIEVIIEENPTNLSYCKKNEPTEKNVTNFNRKIPSSNDEYVHVCLIKINNFQEFLDQGKEFESDEFYFYLPKFDIKLIGKAIIFPTNEKFSVKVSFMEDTEYEVNEITGNNSKVVRKNKKQLKLDNFLQASDCFNYKQMFSERVQKIMEDNEITFKLAYGIYSKARKFFTKTRNEKINLNNNNIQLIENFYDYPGLLYDKLVNPFIFRIRVVGPGKSPEKCEDALGIVNEGNNCYMNSILQCLYNMKLLRKAVYNISSVEDTPLYSIQKIFYNLQHEKPGTNQKILHLFRNLEWDKSFWNSQQDVQEIFTIIFDILNDNEKAFLEDKGIIENLCVGVLKTNIKCVDFDYESEKFEKFLFLQLDIEHETQLVKCIENFLRVESLVGDNKYETNDKIKREAVKNFAFEKIPPVLFVQLKRFKYDEDVMIKLHSKLEYPKEIDFSDYYNTKGIEMRYSLYAVIVHDGVMNSGHYYVYIRDFLNNRWIKFNDTKVTIASEEEVFEQNFGGYEEEAEITDQGAISYVMKENYRTAYILSYVQNERISDIFQNLVKEDIPECLLQLLHSNRISKNRFPFSGGDYASFYGDNINNNYNDFKLTTNKQNIRHTMNSNNSNIEQLKNISRTINSVSKGNTISINKNSKRKKLQDRYTVNMDIISRDNSVSNKYNPNVIRNNKINHNNIGFADKKGKNDLIQQILKNKPELSNQKNGMQNNSENGNGGIINNITSNYSFVDLDKNENQPPKINSINTIAITHNNNSKSKNSVSNNNFSDRKNLTRVLTLSYLDNLRGSVMTSVRLDKAFDQKILAMSFIEECHKKIPSGVSIELTMVKMAILSKTGFFVRFINEDEQIEDLLFRFWRKNFYICFYVFNNMDEIFSQNMDGVLTVALHLMKDNFSNSHDPVDIFQKSSNLPKAPMILILENSVPNDTVFRNKIVEAVKKSYDNMTSSVKILIVESNSDRLIDQDISNYSQIKVSRGLNSYEFARITNKNVVTDSIIRIVLESTKIFYSHTSD